MRLPNEWASKITDKNPDTADKAAYHIIDNKDMDAWSCLAEHEEHIFDFVKEKVSQRLINAVTEENFDNIFTLMQRYNLWLSDVIALSASKFDNPDIHDRMLEYLINGDADQRAYAARYFIYINFKPSEPVLIKYLESEDENLKLNAAEALGAQKSEKAYTLLIEKLKTDDDWEKASAAELLSALGNPDAIKPILKAMENSSIKENLASEAACITCLANFFTSSDEELCNLSLEAVDSIITGLPEILPLGNILAYQFYECIETLLNLAKHEDNSYSGKYAQILLRAKNKFRLLINNDQYTYDESKDIKEEIKHIHNILDLRDTTFWDDMTYLLIEELHSQDFNRKMNAITTVAELGLTFAGNRLVNLIRNESTHELIACQAVYTIQEIKYTEALPALKNLLIRINDPNRSAIIENTIKILENIKKEPVQN